MLLNAKQIVTYTGGSFLVEALDPRNLATGLVWDSREVTPGVVYVALPGERVDGHDFVDSALNAGALVVLVSRPLHEKTYALAREMGASIIEVASTYTAVTDLARAWRGYLKGKVIGLTGSSGKTTTKNLVRDVLAARYQVVATKGNQNNELGVPRTILNADRDTDYVVVEMGMRGLGQIEQLCSFVKPDMGLIVNVGESHIELLGGKDNIARAKGELFQALPAGTGVAFVNAGDAYAPFLIEHAQLEKRNIACVSFGGDAASNLSAQEVWAEDVHLDDQGRPQFTLCARGFDGAQAIQSAQVSLTLRGLHNVSNATAAAAVALRCSMNLSEIAQALSAAEPEAGRQQVIKARAGYTVINDAYNANPESMRASLVTFSAMATKGKRVAVLGDMGELGDYAKACHEGIGELIPTLNIDVLICVGELSAYIAEAALRAGMNEDTIIRAHSVSEVLGALDILLEPNDAVLVKASHFMGLSRVVEGLIY